MFILYAELSFVPHHTPIAILFINVHYLEFYSKSINAKCLYHQYSRRRTRLCFKRCIFLYFQLLVYILHTIYYNSVFCLINTCQLHADITFWLTIKKGLVKRLNHLISRNEIHSINMNMHV